MSSSEEQVEQVEEIQNKNLFEELYNQFPNAPFIVLILDVIERV